MANNPTSPQILETYALLQIAAEAFLNASKPNDPAKPPTGSAPFNLTAKMVADGNGHSSRMTAQQAVQFAEKWTVVSHQPNTATGFSGTLFQYLGQDDVSRGLTHGQYVVSFRSTEFIEDTARDNQATNTLELAEGGWAFGQVADMDTWWQSVKSQVGTQGVDVTGYSLGGSLAASFFELYGSKANGGVVNKVYTFNGAGVGTVDADYSLRGVIDQFKAQSQLGANAEFFTDPVARAEYARLQSLFSSQPDGSANAVTRARAVEQRDVLLAEVQGYLGYLPAMFEFNSNAGANEQEFRDVA